MRVHESDDIKAVDILQSLNTRHNLHRLNCSQKHYNKLFEGIQAWLPFKNRFYQNFRVN